MWLFAACPIMNFQWNSKIPQTRNSNPQLGNTTLFHCMLQMQMFRTNMGSLNRWPLLWLLVHMCFPCLSLATCQSNQQMPRIPKTHQNHASKRVQRLQKIRASLASKQHGETCCDTKTISYCFLSCFDVIELRVRVCFLICLSMFIYLFFISELLSSSPPVRWGLLEFLMILCQSVSLISFSLPPRPSFIISERLSGILFETTRT